MKDNRSDKVKSICEFYIDSGCRDNCPLAEPCKAQAGDTKEIFDNRMNSFAEGVKLCLN